MPAVAVGCAAAGPSAPAAEKSPFLADEIRAVARSVADWQLDHPSRDPLDWTNAVFYSGVLAAHRMTGEDRYLAAVRAVGVEAGWSLGNRYRHADDHAVAQSYLELYRLEGDPVMIAALRRAADRMLAEPADWPKEHQKVDYWWSDALFMSPPALAMLAEATGDERYLDLADRLWRESYDLLYDRSMRLFHRDLRFRSEPNPRFWSRGNAWVHAGLARWLEALPAEHPTRPFYERLFLDLSARIPGLQGSDGLWRSDLLASVSSEPGETSGSALFCAALAWGINQGLLEPARFRQPAEDAWKALYRNVDDEGRLGWVQKPGAKPGGVSRRHREAYGSGAFLLAAEQMLELVSP